MLLSFLIICGVGLNLNMLTPHKKLVKPQFPVKSSLTLEWSGPEGGMILKPITGPYNPRKVVAASFTDIWKCEDITASSFQIVTPLEYTYPNFFSPGVMTGINRFVINSGDKIYFTQDNFTTVDSFYNFYGDVKEIVSKGDTVYFVTTADSLYLSTDGGVTFSLKNDFDIYLDPTDSKNYEYLLAVNPNNAKELYVFAYNDSPTVFLYSNDAGLTFPTQVNLDTVIYDATTLRVAHFNSNYVYVTVPGTGIFYSTDKGNTWNLLPILSPYNVVIIDLIPLNADTLLISSAINPGIFRLYKSGIVWYSEIVDTFFFPFFFSPIYKNGGLNDTVYVGSNDGIYYSTDKGKTWTQYKTGLKAIYLFQNGSMKYDTAYAVTGGGIFYGTYDLMNYFQIDFPGTPFFLARSLVATKRKNSKTIALISPYIRSQMLAPPILKSLWYSFDGGNTFINTSQESFLVDNVEDFFFGKNDDTLFFVLDYPHHLVRTQDKGATFDTVFFNAYDYEGEGDTIFALRTDTLFISTNAGDTFVYFDTLSASDFKWNGISNYLLYFTNSSANVYYYEIQSKNRDTVFNVPSNYNLIDYNLGDDGWVYTIYEDTVTHIYMLYSKPSVTDTVMYVDTLPSGLHYFGVGGYGNKIIFIVEGRGIYRGTLVDVKEKYKGSQEKEVSILYYDLKGNIIFFSSAKTPDFKLFDITGRYVKGIKLSRNGNFYKLNLVNLPAGSYYLVENKSKKIIKFLKLK